MRIKLSPVVFSVGYCGGYMLAFRLNMPLFRYYPVPHRWALGASDGIVRPGPPIVWYGLVVSATLMACAATLIAAAAPMIVARTASGTDRLHPTILRGWVWLTPWSAAAYCAFLLRLFFV